MSAEEFTPAVERAAELLIHEAETTGLIHEDVRRGLDVAFDVEEMAQAIYDVQVVDTLAAGTTWENEPDDQWKESCRREARAVRESILGQS